MAHPIAFMTDPEIKIVSDWPDVFIDRLSAFYASRQEFQNWSMWGERWDWSPEYFRWKCASNPISQSIAAVGFHQGQIVGCVIVTFKRMRHRESEFVVGELGDLYVNPPYRKRGLFRNLVRQATMAARAAGAQLIYCIPNGEAFDALVASGDFVSMPDIEHATWLLPLRPVGLLAATRSWLRPYTFLDLISRAAAKLINCSRESELVRRTTPAMTELPQSKSELRVVYPYEVMDYRIFRGPGHTSYDFFASTTAPAKAVVLKNVSYYGRRALLVGRCFVAQPQDFSDLIPLIVHQSLTIGAAFVALWAPRADPYSGILWRHGFVPLQRKRVAIDIDAVDRINIDILAQFRVEMMDSDKA